MSRRRCAFLVTSALVLTGAFVAASPGPAGALPCAAVAPSARSGWVRTELRQLSGLARLPGQPDVLWAHNDRGIRDFPAPGEDVTNAAVWALRADGTLLARFTLADALGAPIPYDDTEAIALGPGGRLVLADTGTNGYPRTTVRLLRFTPPAVSSVQPFTTGVIGGVEQVPVQYFASSTSTTPLLLNVEAVTVDGNGDAWFLPRDGASQVTPYRASAAALATAAATGVPARAVATTRLTIGNTITDASRSPDGAWLVVKNLTKTWAWPLAGRPIGDVISTAPCVATIAGGTQKPGYGEAISVLDDGTFVTVREAGKDPATLPKAPIWSFTA